MTKLILVAFLFLSWQLQAQIIIPTANKMYFNYDEAGNQILRYEDLITSSSTAPVEEGSKITTLHNQNIISEDDFWNNIRIYPVPVKEFLTIDWSEKVDDFISEVSLYEQNTLHWVFQSKKADILNRSLKINMSQRYRGVFVLTFVLKDGRRISKNITKN